MAGKFLMSPLESWCFRFDSLSRFFAVILGFMIPLSTTGTAVAAVSAVCCVLLGGKYREKWLLLRHSSVALLSLLLFVLLLISLSYTAAPAHEAYTVLFKFNKLIWLALLLPCFVLPQWRRNAMIGFIAGALIVLFASYLKYYGFIHIGNPEFPNGPFNDYIQTTFILTLLAFFSLHSAVRFKAWRWPALIVAVMAIFNVYFMSDGRTGYIILSVTLVLFCFQQWRLRGILIGVLAVAVFSGLAYHYSSNFKDRVLQGAQNLATYHGDTSYSSLGLRYSFYRNGLKVILSSPVFGSGVGSAAADYHRVAPDIPGNVANPHNEYLNITMQLGVVGLAVLLGLFYSFFKSALQLPSFYRFLAQGVLVTIMVGSLFNSWLMDIMEGYAFVYFSAVFFAGLSAEKAKI